MVDYCCAYDCYNNSTMEGLSWHGFPEDKKLIKSLGRRILDMATPASDTQREGEVPLEEEKPPIQAQVDQEMDADSADEADVLLDLQGGLPHAGARQETSSDTLGGRDDRSYGREPGPPSQAGTNNKVDFVLVYQTWQDNEAEDVESQKKTSDNNAEREKREKFEQNLEEAGLRIIGREEAEPSPDVQGVLRSWLYDNWLKCRGSTAKEKPKRTLHFVLLEAQWKELVKLADEMRLKVPFQVSDIDPCSWMEKIIGEKGTKLLNKINPLVVKDRKLKDKPKYFMTDFREDRISLYLNDKNKEKFFEDADRAFIAQKICSRTPFGDQEKGEYGLEKLIHDGVYQAGYFPHDGPVLLEASGEPVLPDASGEPVLPEAYGEPVLPEASGEPVLPEASGESVVSEASGEPAVPEASGESDLSEASGEPVVPEASGESVLSEASDEVYTIDRQGLKRDWARFGRIFKFQPYEAIKDYFGSEIAFYFAWLGFYTAWLVPLAIVGLAVFFYGIGSAGNHIPVQDVCEEKNRGVWYMCPLCDKHCSYWDLASTTCVYAYVTHFFDNDGTVFLALIASIWGTLFLEFWKRRQASLAHEWHTNDLETGGETYRPKYSTEAKNYQKQKNLVTNKWERRIPKVRVYACYFGSIVTTLFMATLVLATVFGVLVYRAAVFVSLSGGSSSRMVTSVSASCLNLVAINVLKILYNKLAVWLTDWENPPTRSEYEDSFTWKMYSFHFVNTYASIFYIAFFKQSVYVIGIPGRYKRIAGVYRLDSCSEQGCFLELCVQLLVIMVGQQLIRIVFEVGIPLFLYWVKNRKIETDNRPQYQRDYDLHPHKDHYMFWEYLDVVLQFGFATMFVAAFPLGPFFALLISIIQIRVDAINFVCQFRRPAITRTQGIGAWLPILEIVTKMSVLVNAFVLAFTSEFIPKLLYRLSFAPDRDEPGGGTLKGYLDNSLASINVSYIHQQEPGAAPRNINGSDTCRYAGYHESVWPYEFSKQYWEIIAARLAFVFVFQCAVFLVKSFIAWFVPNVPGDLKLKSDREKHLFKEKLTKKN